MPRKKNVITVESVDSDQTADEDTVRASDELIAEFFEARPYYYDQGDSDYKNKQRRNAELAEFAKTIGRGFTADSIWKRFVSIRTDIGKLKKANKIGKSGQAPKALTDLQHWKVKRYAFLDAYIKRRSLGEEIGKGASNQVESDAGDSENDGSFDDVQTKDGDKVAQTEKASGSGERTRKKPKTANNIAQVLEKMLDESNKEMRAADRRVERLCQERQNQPVDERRAWGEWLTNACLAMPTGSFRNFQRDTFEAYMRYLPNVPPVPSPPVTCFSGSTGQPVQFSAQLAPQTTLVQDHPQSYLSLLQDQRPASQQSYSITNLDNVSKRNSPIPNTTGVWNINPNANSSSLISQAFRNAIVSGATNSQELTSKELQIPEDDQ